MKNKTRKTRIFIKICLCLYVLLTIFLVVQASLGVKSSSEQSDTIGSGIADIIDSIKGDQTKFVELEEIEVKNKFENAFVGDSIQLEITFIPENTSYKSLIYSSSNNRVATISNSGLINFISEGEVTFLIKSTSFDKVKYEFTVSVYNVQLEEIDTKLLLNDSKGINEVSKDNKGNYILNQYQNYFIKNVFSPSKYVPHDIEYIYDERYVSISNDTLFTKASSYKELEIIIKCEGITSSINVIINRTSSDFICLDKIESDVSFIKMSKGEEIDLIYNNPFNINFIPNNSSNKILEYYSSDESIVSIKNNKIKALNKGIVNVYICSNEDYDINFICEIKVDDISVSSFGLNVDNSNITKLVKGIDYNLNICNVIPYNASCLYNDNYINYFSNNENVIKIENGIIKTVNPGLALITVYIQTFDSSGNPSSFVTSSIQLEVFETNEIDDFNISFNGLNNNILYNSNVYENFKSKIKIEEFYYKGNVVNYNDNEFSIELVSNIKGISYDPINDKLNVNANNSSELFFVLTHIKTGISKVFSLYVIDEIKINNIDYDDINNVYMIEKNVGDILNINFANGSINKSYYINDNLFYKCLEYSNNVLSLELLEEGELEIFVKEIFNDNEFEETSKKIKVIVKHKKVNDFNYNLTYNNSIKEIDGKFEGESFIVNAYNKDEFILDIDYGSNISPSIQNLNINISDDSIITYSNGIIKIIGAGKSILSITDLQSGISKDIIFDCKNIIKLSKDAAVTIIHPNLTLDNENHIIHVLNGYSGQIINNFTEDTTYTFATYISSDEKIMTIGSDGVFTALKAGHVFISVSIDDGYSEKVTYTFHFIVDKLDAIQDIDSFIYNIRKQIGHFGAFMLLGILGTFGFLLLFDKKKWLFSVPLNIFLGFFIAGLTELIQRFVPGRNGSWDDVFLDFSGFMIATSVIMSLIFISYYYKYRKNLKSNIAYDDNNSLN